MSTKEMKEIRAEKAKAKYQANPKTEQLRKFLFRVNKGIIPTMMSMKKYGFTLDAVNKIRDDAGLDPIENHSIKGYRREQMNLMITDTNEVLKSVIPNVHVFESMKKSANSDKPVTVQHIDLSANITLDVYLECLRNKPVSASTVDIYEKRLRPILIKLGWTKNKSIVGYLKNFEKVSKIIESTYNSKKGKSDDLLAPGTNKMSYQSISVGLHKKACPPFVAQMGPEAVKKYTAKTSSFIQDTVEDRRDRVQNKKYVKWEDILKVVDDKIINNENVKLEDKVFWQIYTGLGGSPRTGTFLKLNIVDTMADTEDETKNYYVKDSQTIISNVHKTGKNHDGEAIIEDLRQYPALAKNIKQLAEEKKIEKKKMIFKFGQNAASPKWHKLFGDDEKGASMNNWYLRHSNATWALRKEMSGHLDIFAQSLKINAHSEKTARDYYAPSKKTMLEEEAAANNVEEVVVKKKKAVVKKVAAPVPRKTAMVAAVVQKEVRKNTRADAIVNIVKAMKQAPPIQKAVVINEPQPDVRRSTREKAFTTIKRGDHVIMRR